jgi:hypothetical protein
MIQKYVMEVRRQDIDIEIETGAFVRPLSSNDRYCESWISSLWLARLFLSRSDYPEYYVPPPYSSTVQSMTRGRAREQRGARIKKHPTMAVMQETCYCKEIYPHRKILAGGIVPFILREKQRALQTCRGRHIWLGS